MISLQARPFGASFLLLIFINFSPAIPDGGGTPFRASDLISGMPPINPWGMKVSYTGDYSNA
jgi:hypothetical protein